MPFLIFPLTFSREKLEKIACETLKKGYPSLECKGITYYGDRLELPEGAYIFDIKKSGNSYLLEIINAENLKVVKLIPVKVYRKGKGVTKKRVRAGKRVKLVFIKGNIVVESSGILLESGKVGETVEVRRGKKIFYGRLKDENTVVVELP